MTSLRASAAFLVLPGLVVYLRKALKGQRGETVVCILRTFAAAEDIEELTLERAQAVQESVRAELVAREDNRRPPTRQQLKRLAENRADRGRLSLAMKAVEQLHCLQTGQEQARRLSYDESKGIIKDLHPERTEDPESLPWGDMASLPPGLELTLENVVEGFQRIDVSSAAGSFTGWTNGVIKSLFLSSHAADRTEFLEAFRDLDIGFCGGTVSHYVAYLWAISRAVGH